MHPSPLTARRLIGLLMALVVPTALASSGCSRADYRLRADQDAYLLVAERNVDPRWSVADFDIEPNPDSRFYDPYEADCPPMPQDDPTANQYMQMVDGKRGWAHWLDNGIRGDLENPHWRESLYRYVDVNEQNEIELDLDSALNLAYLHSPNHQTQLETLYLTSLDVSAERFRLDTQLFGGYDATYAHRGGLAPGTIVFNPTLGRYVVTPPLNGVESNRLTIGGPTAGTPTLQANQRFATAADVLVGFANSFVFEFTGGDANLGASLANFSFIQPLLREAGRDIALEQLTKSERDLLAALRAYSQFRQGFFTQVSIGELGVSSVSRTGSGTSLQSFNGSGGVGGYLGLLQQLQRIRNTADNLSLQERTLEQLTALLEVGIIDLVQVDQFRQSVEFERSRLLQDQNSYELQLDFYKTSVLGLPPDLVFDLDDSMIQKFQLIDRQATAVQDSIVGLQDRVGVLPEDVDLATTIRLFEDVLGVLDSCSAQLASTRSDINQMVAVIPQRRNDMTPEAYQTLEEDRDQLLSTMTDLENRLMQSAMELQGMSEGLTPETRVATTRRLVVWLGNLLRIMQRSVLIQARARLETISVDSVELQPEDAFRIALDNRLDFMNGRASLVDQWRIIQVRADALQAVLNVTGNGDLRTTRNNAASFRAPTANLQLGLEFDAPLTRLLERNDYRESLIQYQQSRRRLIQSRDSLHLGLRALLRNLEQLRENLEIQRRAVAIAIRRVDQTRASLYAPVPPPRPGQRAVPFGPTAAQNLLLALSSLRDTQNSLLATYLDYYAGKLRLARELGVMQLDEQGRWIEVPFEQLQQGVEQLPPGDSGDTLPPQVPTDMLDLSQQIRSIDEQDWQNGTRQVAEQADWNPTFPATTSSRVPEPARPSTR